MKIRNHRELEVYRMAFKAAMEIFEITKGFPVEERYSLTDQIRRASRSVCANIPEAFRKRKYPRYFISKIIEAEGESSETQTWLDFSLACKYINKDLHEKLNRMYDNIIGKLVNMSLQPEKWKW